MCFSPCQNRHYTQYHTKLTREPSCRVDQRWPECRNTWPDKLQRVANLRTSQIAKIVLNGQSLRQCRQKWKVHIPDEVSVDCTQVVNGNWQIWSWMKQWVLFYTLVNISSLNIYHKHREGNGKFRDTAHKYFFYRFFKIPVKLIYILSVLK